MTTADSKTPEAQPPRRPWLRRMWASLPSFLVFVLLVVLIVLMADRIKLKGETLKSQKSAQMQTAQPPPNVVTLNLAPSPIRDRINLPGIVEPWVQLDVLTEVRGKVLARAVSEGSLVKKGAIILTLDARDYQNAFNSAKTAHDVALAQLNRLEELKKEDLSTRSQLDNALAQEQSTRALLDSAALDLERCTLRAPISGIINNLYVEEGQFLDPSMRVAEILQLNRVKVTVGIPESDVDAVRRLDAFDVRIDALDGKIFKAKRHFLSKTADAMARLYNLKLEVPNRSGEILPDMFARVEIIKQEVAASLSIPLYAVISRNDSHIVYVVEDDVVAARTVKLGLQEGWRIQVKEGLSAGDQVIVVGQRSVSPGQTVSVVRTVADPEELLQ
jgi:membrane fusion protein, multidrug efflux system